ncbi:MAG: hypothetical protein QNI84_17405 [Henriciella sp.]|nr:hypothetical protein [Henriciella sp.]
MTKHQDIGTQAGSKLLYDLQGAAALLSMTPGALRDLCYKGRGPVVTKVGRRTFFYIDDLIAFIRLHREVPLR